MARTVSEAFERPGASRGSSAFPRIRFVSLVENGTRVLFGSRMGPCAEGERSLARGVVAAASSPVCPMAPCVVRAPFRSETKTQGLIYVP